MSAANVVASENRLIGALPRGERRRFLAASESTDLVLGRVLCEPDGAYHHIYFPLSGFISLVASVSGHPPLEVALIGNEGVLGATVVLGMDLAPLRSVVQGAGSALCISIEDIKLLMPESPALRRVLNRYIYVVMAQLSQNAACARFHEIEPRLARWLLMTHDRAHADYFYLTHKFLADMLGVQRSAVTIAAGALQRRQLIDYSRGRINVLSRSGLEAAACECYAAAEKDDSDVFG